jgi:hypothetical protein
MKKTIYLYIVVAMLIKVQAQNVTITPAGITPALSGNYPRISYTAILALPSPQQGDIAFDTTNKCLRIYVDGKWVCTYQDPDTYPNAISVISAGGTGDDTGTAIATDTSGNVYITGSFFGLATFGVTNKISIGESDIFVAKYNKNGALQWVQSAGGIDEDSGQSIAVDNSGNVYVIGYYQVEATFGASTDINALGGLDIFLAKYNSNGVFQWVQSAGGTGNEDGSGIVLDVSGNVYATGYYEGTSTFDGIGKTSQGNTDLFIAKYNSSGVVQWVQSEGGTGHDISQAIAIDGNGKLYITGSFTGTTKFGIINKTSLGGHDIFVAKFDPATSGWSYIQSAGGTNDQGGQSIAVDASGNAYIIGYFQGGATFGGTTKISQGGGDIFVVKCNSSGVFQWVQSAGSSESESGHDIAIDSNGNVYATGFYNGVATFGSITKIPEGFGDIFVTKYNNAGTLQWIKSIGSSGYDYGQSIVVDGGNNVIVSGRYSGVVNFDKTIRLSKGNTDMFVLKLDK